MRFIPKNILIVDDSEALRQVVAISLESAGYNVFEAKDGLDGLTKLNNNCVHLIITDFNMPWMDGVEFITKAKRLPTQKFTPIIMLTTECHAELTEEGRKIGIKCWLNKPFKPEKLLEAVNTLLTH